MESIFNSLSPAVIDKVYFIALCVCLIANYKIPKVFQLAVITLMFNAFSHLFVFDFLYSLGQDFWSIGWCFYELMLIFSIVINRVIVNKTETNFLLSDILLISGSVVQIFVYTVTYIAKNSGMSAMNVIYSVTAPTLYVLTITVLLFPAIYRFVGLLQGYKEFDSAVSNNNNNNRISGLFSNRIRARILGY